MWNLAKQCLALAAIAALGTGCGGDIEEKRAAHNLNEHPEIVARGGHVEKVELREGRAGTFPFEAEILSVNKSPIGVVRGVRVEGFGTRIHRIQWFDEDGNPEADAERGQRGQRRFDPERAQRWRERTREGGEGRGERPNRENRAPSETAAE